MLEKYAKGIRYACRNDIEIFTEAAMKAFDVPPENIFTLLNQQATYQGLKEGISQFANHVPEDSRVIMLFNFHGDLTDAVPDDTTGDEEVLVLWTKEKPFTLLTAITLKQWVTAEALRGMIDGIRAKEIVIIIDACHSGGAIPEIMKRQGRESGWSGREAVIASSKADQFSYFTMDGTNAVFTSNLSEALRSGFPTLKTAFDRAAKETSKYVDNYKEKCEEMLRSLIHERQTCVQTPVDDDPTSLLTSIKLN